MQNGQTERVSRLPEASPHLISLATIYVNRNSWLVPSLCLSQKMVIDHFLKKEEPRSVKDLRLYANLVSGVSFSARREVRFVRSQKI